MELQNQTSCDFILVDDSDKVVDWSWTVLEIVLHDQKYDGTHKKRQQFIGLEKGSEVFYYDMMITQVCLQSLSGTTVNPNLAGKVLGLYCDQTGDEPLCFVIIDDELQIRGQVKDVFIFQAVQGNSSQLRFKLRDMDGNEVEMINMMVRILLKTL